MSRLTEKDNSGNWSVKGLSWNELFTGQTITKRKQEIIYGCLAKLKDYEDSELSPEQVQQYKDSGWIPVNERYPENDDYILLSFENFSLPTVGRYEENEEGGAFFVGDDDISCASSGLYVNAWQPLPKRYEENCRFTKEDRESE